MILKEEITAEWLVKVSTNNRKADKILIEKVIRALLLLEGLVKAKLPFVFKGGTALMLHFNSAKRLSIDIDIILPAEPENLKDILEHVAKEQGFVKKELQHRDQQLKVKKEHYKFFYKPVHKTLGETEYVLLDILFEKVNYSQLISIPLASDFVPADSEMCFVNVPGLEDILGDKLTAFAPNTTGIPYFKNEGGMGMEIIKQLYDIGNLLELVSDMTVVRKTFNIFAETEIAYRNPRGINTEDVLSDIFQTALCISTRGADGKGNFDELKKGMQRITGFIFSESYHIEKVISHASKAAYLSVVLKAGLAEIVRYKDAAQMKEWLIGKPLNTKLNKLKKTNPEAFYYWYRAYEILSRE